MAQIPVIRQWELYFDKIDGLENREKVATGFAKYWNEHSLTLFNVPGTCMLGGKIYDREGFLDGSEIFTSTIRSFRRIETGYKNGAPHDLILTTTRTGNLYYYYSDEHNTYMALMLEDLIHTGSLNGTPGYYLDRQYRGSRLF